MKTKLCLLLLVFTLVVTKAHSQTQAQSSTYRKFFVGSSLFVLPNLFPHDNPPDFIQLNFGYRITPKNVVSVEVKTWRYA